MGACILHVMQIVRAPSECDVPWNYLYTPVFFPLLWQENTQWELGPVSSPRKGQGSLGQQWCEHTDWKLDLVGSSWTGSWIPLAVRTLSLPFYVITSQQNLHPSWRSKADTWGWVGLLSSTVINGADLDCVGLTATRLTLPSENDERRGISEEAQKVQERGES